MGWPGRRTGLDDQRPVRRIAPAPDQPADPRAWWAAIPAVAQVLRDGLDLPAGVTFLVGENGSGKSTLIEGMAMAYGLNAEGGSVNARHQTRSTESELAGAIQLVRSPGRRGHAYFLRAETMHGLYSYLEDLGGGTDGELHYRSHGEGFLELLAQKFDGAGFYLMDEPEAALSFTSTLSLVATLNQLRSAGAQVVVATHSPLLTAMPGATVLELGDHGIRPAEWEDLDLVQNWRSFLSRPRSYLDRLFG